MKKLTTDEMVGQLLMPRFSGVYTSSDSDVFDQLTTLVRDAQVGGVIGFGGEEPAPQVLLNPTYGPHHPRPAAGAGVDDQPAAGARRDSAADGCRFRVGRRHADRGRDEVSARDGVWRGRRRAARVRSRARHRARGTRARRARRLRAGGRRQHEPAQSGDQHSIVRRGSGARRRADGRVRARAAAGRHARDAEALSRARRHRGRLASRAAGDPASADAARCRSSSCRSRPGLRAGAAGVMVGHIELPALDAASGPGDVQPARRHRPAANAAWIRRTRSTRTR